MTEGFVFAAVIIIATILLTFVGFKNEIREWRHDVDERDERDREAITVIPGPYDETIPILGETPKPRPIRLSSRAKWMGSFVLLPPLALFFIVTYDQRRYLTAGTMGGTLTFCFVMAALIGGVFWLPPYVRHKALILDGEVAIGKITKVAWGGRGSTYVYYEFQTPSGEKVRKISRTLEIGLAAGMKVPVFYNQETPKKAVALCTSFYDVVLPERAKS